MQKSIKTNVYRGLMNITVRISCIRRKMIVLCVHLSPSSLRADLLSVSISLSGGDMAEWVCGLEDYESVDLCLLRIL